MVRYPAKDKQTSRAGITNRESEVSPFNVNNNIKFAWNLDPSWLMDLKWISRIIIVYYYLLEAGILKNRNVPWSCQSPEGVLLLRNCHPSGSDYEVAVQRCEATLYSVRLQGE